MRRRIKGRHVGHDATQLEYEYITKRSEDINILAYRIAFYSLKNSKISSI